MDEDSFCGEKRDYKSLPINRRSSHFFLQLEQIISKMTDYDDNQRYEMLRLLQEGFIATPLAENILNLMISQEYNEKLANPRYLPAGKEALICHPETKITKYTPIITEKGCTLDETQRTEYLRLKNPDKK